MSTEALTTCRKDMLSSIAPVVYTRHAREAIMPDIAGLPFPETETTNLVSLAMSRTVRNVLELSQRQAKSLARKNGVKSLASKHDIFHWGYGDRHFPSELSAVFALEIGRFLLREEVIKEELSMKDSAKMFQTGWFGDIANQMALAGRGFIQPFCDHYQYQADTTSFKTDFFDARYRYKGEVFETELEPESGLSIVKLTMGAKKVVRGTILRSGVGCPVARTSVMATEAQVKFLEDHGHLEGSGFYIDQDIETESGRIKLSQGAYTAIDDVIWQWGEYVDRYADHLLQADPGLLGVAATGANERVLLD